MMNRTRRLMGPGSLTCDLELLSGYYVSDKETSVLLRH